MSYYFENQNPAVMANGFNTTKAITTTSTLAVTGATTLSSTLAVTGTSTFTGAATFTVAPIMTLAPTGPQVRATASSAAVGATVVLTAADSGKVLINASTSGSPSWTLPTAAAGLYFSFVCGNTTAGFTVTGGTVHAKTSATGTAVSGTTLTNTQATAVVGDTITLVCDGTAWWPVAQTGIFTAA